MLTAWANTVAMAAPSAPMCSGPTSSRSPTMFTQQEMVTKIMGRRESPMPRSMPQMTL